MQAAGEQALTDPVQREPAVPPVADASRTVRRGWLLAVCALVAFTAERITGIEIVQLYSDEERTLARFDDRLAPYRSANVSTNVWDALMYAMVDGVTSIKMALMHVVGVSKAKVSYDRREARVTFDDEKTNVVALTEATKDVGYPSFLADRQP